MHDVYSAILFNFKLISLPLASKLVTHGQVRWPKGTKISDFIFSAYRKIKSEIFQKISDFIFSTCKKIKSEILLIISDFIFLTVLINELITLFMLISKIS